MSVNEVKLQKAPEPFVVTGSGPPSARTFKIGDEDHTLGNSLRHILIRNKVVGFAGYSVPHPSEPVVNIRVQTVPENPNEAAPTAADTLKEACQTLSDQCDIVLEKVEELFPEARDDRIAIEKIFLEEGYEDGNEDDDDEDMMEE